ncbi:MAG: hypothetical protein AABX27_02125 [Nanoarchaeota archaeon]
MGLEHVLGKYGYFLNDEDALMHIGSSGIDTYHDTIDFVLSPKEINEFLQKTRDFNLGQCSYNRITGLYVTKLIQNSFNAGHSRFHLSMPMELDCVGFGLKGSLQQNVIVDVDYSLGSSCFTGSERCSAFIVGSVKNNFARCAKNSVFEVKGNTGYATAGYSTGCMYYFYGEIKSGFDCAKGNEFKAYSEQALKTFKKYVPSGNLIWHVKNNDSVHPISITRLRDRFPFLEHFMRRH